MQCFIVTVGNKDGLHARPASLIMQCASAFESDIYLIVDEERVNAKSIMSLIGVSAVQGSQVTIEVDGDDEEEAKEALCTLFASKFGEE